MESQVTSRVTSRVTSHLTAALVASLIAAAGTPLAAQNGAPDQKTEKAPDFPPFDKVTEGLTKVVSTADGAAPFTDLYKDDQTGKLLGVLPADFDKLIMIAPTISGGDAQAGVMGPTHYVKWERIDKQLALIAPNLSVRTDGDKQAKDSIEQLYTGRVLFAVPILTMQGPRPVIDLGAIATKHAGRLYGYSIFGQYGPNLTAVDASLARLTKAKAFPENVIFEYRLPGPGGQLVSLTYNISKLEGTPGFKPRKADSRVGYFYDWHQDFARPATADITDRYITRWHLEKADPKLKVSPPKEPIVWYVEHTTPVKFRRWVKEGIEFWNEAYAEIGIVGAVEVRQQDAETGAFMDIDPEDARYNFFRWNASDQSYAIGPSRTNPETGEILDADVVWHQGLTRGVRGMLENLSDDLTAQAFGAETLAWLDEHPTWDPRVRLAPPESRAKILQKRAIQAESAAATELSAEDHPWTSWTSSHANAACRIGNLLSLDISLADSALAAGLLAAGEGEDDTEMLDGLPEEFIGPMIRYISAHEVGHCLGLQHNMAASTIRSLEEVNSEGFDGPTVGSVMDYVGANINHELGEVQGPYATPALGPYDRWAIAYGYGPEEKLPEVLARVSEPDHIFISQSAMGAGSDPRNMTWDYGSDNIKFAESRMGIVRELRGKLVSDIVDEGESWAVARRRFSSLQGTHLQSLFIVAPWIGGSFINNDFKGDPGNRAPVEDVPAERQRQALSFVIANSFEDAAYGLTPELLRHLGKEYWWDPQGIDELMADPSVTVHDSVGGIQATALTLIMNPTRLRRVYDNEFRATGEDVFTLDELVRAVGDNVWRECVNGSTEISSFRRNLQREHVQRLTDLALMDDATSPTLRTISTLARHELRRIDELSEKALEAKADAYTRAHLEDIRARVAKTLEAAYVIGR